ncbi:MULTISPECIES: DUF2076 domain-containing protein [unclassified Massilia]|uniref:DUF2076 domain-containing protein n=1 Tax=unclassified Massilia TaxID=2609279 RepID=UPI00178573C5|nr:MULTISPECIES: DUF2076 domain-containing protein [unclassified Massilia]MBD8528404.1 DUF2076 family protein [Massilia sp. CFBP 13647]MBD8671974.1 DUF2076 family protein [Massilia sp. CFBP 13721]
MSPQDTQLLENFLNQLIEARGLPKDPEADAMIQKAVSYQPDAAYLLVQRALLQQQALDNAKAEIANLQRQLQGGSQGGGFLDPNAWGNSSGQRQPTQAYGSRAVPPAHPQQVQQPYQQPYQQPSLSSRASNFFRGGGMGGGGMGGALGSIASTAAGVAAGAFLFQGLGHLLGQHNHDGNGFLGNNDSFSSLTSPIEDFNNSGADDQSSSLLGDGGSDGGNSMLDDLGMGSDNFAGDNYDGGSDDSSFS